MATDPQECGLCGERLLKKGVSGYPQRAGRVFEIDDREAIDAMAGTSERRREGEAAAAVRVGLCPSCLADVGLDEDGDGGSDADRAAVRGVADRISLDQATVVSDGE